MLPSRGDTSRVDKTFFFSICLSDQATGSKNEYKEKILTPTSKEDKALGAAPFSSLKIVFVVRQIVSWSII